ncbi:GntR family transcriptional regulator [Virgibacillus salexigens]|uniref:HTH-type transcriptional repressor YvoA n=1 Tax=Virgibacillus massiliensis TaxID=1462526 RepID=A0A024Q858_9BACI|nr:GntR family transcriptional regulator [Virgibacillus massiliensis]CDQ38442.1 HTH-type transcriptional repressor YvoA [Virgibacillus massiliensis]
MDKLSKVPLYLQLMENLIKQIDEQTYQEHEKLPSERELCAMYNLSRITVRQALQELEREGYIYKLHGKGTFVSASTFNQHLVKLYSFTEEMRKLGKTPSTRVLSFKEIAVEDRLAEKMNVQPLDEVYQVVRLRLADDEALMYETSYLPKKIFPYLTKEQLMRAPMYDVFSRDYQVVVTRALEKFSATSLRETEAEYLEVTAQQPAMLIRRFAYHNEQLIEYTVSVARGDKFDYTVELT